MRIGVLVTTFERPDALARALDALAAQSRPPDALVVADDGSGPATAALVRAYASGVPFPVEHARQPHDGFRVARARNLGLARLATDYVVAVDGDMVVDRHFVADHARSARPGRWVQGCRLPLDAAATRAVLAGAAPAALRAALDARHRLQAWRAPALATALGFATAPLLAIKGCNQGYWRADLERANGWDEALVGWGAEDKELAARLHNAGVRRRGLLGAALAWHLHHAPAARDRAAANLARVVESRATRRVRCDRGLDRHAPDR